MGKFRLQAAAVIGSTLFYLLFPAGLFAKVITVGPDETITTIADGIDAAVLQPEKEVLVKAGTYNENVVLQDGIIIEGEEAARVIIDGNFTASNGTMIQAATNTVIQNLTIKNGEVGVDATGVGGVFIRNNLIISNNSFGVQCDNASANLQIFNNVITLTSNGVNGTGISCTSTGSILTIITIENNVLTNNEIGIASSLTNFTNAVILYNNFFGNSTSGASGTNIVTGDPKFVGPAMDDYHLQAGSVCLDAGDPSTLLDDKEVLITPVDHSRNDCGAYGGPNRDTTPFQVQNVVPTAPGTDTIALKWDANLAYNISDYKIYFDNRSHTITDNVPTPPYRNNLTAAATAANCPSATVPPACSINISGLALTAPRNLQVTFGDQELFLDWNPPSTNGNMATSYNVYYKEDTASAWTPIPLGNVNSYTLTGLTNFITYDVKVTALALPTYFINLTALDDYTTQHESSLLGPNISATITCSTPSCESPDSNIANGSPEPVAPFPDLPDQGRCFIATAAYGSPWQPQVKMLRDFRDEYLQPYSLGRRFIAWYYHASPPWAQSLNQHPWLKPAVRAALLPAVGVAYFFVAATGIEKFLILLLIIPCLLGGMFIMRRVECSRG